MDLKEFFTRHRRLALALSGGVDSSYLFCEVLRCGVDVKAYFVKSAFQPEFEWRDVERLVSGLGGRLTVVQVDVLACREVRENPSDRCYFCKLKLFRTLLDRAKEDGYDTIVDGTNASDSVDDRPGMKALQELGVLSPLRLCGLTKSVIRERSRHLGLFTWDKPAYACLATRVPVGMEITADLLDKVERAERVFLDQGFRDFRVRIIDRDTAKIQILEEEFFQLIEKKNRIIKEMGGLFEHILLDLEGRSERTN